MHSKSLGLLSTDARPQQGCRYGGAWRGHFFLPFERGSNGCTGALT